MSKKTPTVEPNHQEWPSRIEGLSNKGFHEWTDAEQERNDIGFYLENKQH